MIAVHVVAFNSNFTPMDQAVAKKTLQELIRREDLKNKICADCSNPNPQWASLRCVGYQLNVARVCQGDLIVLHLMLVSRYSSVYNVQVLIEALVCTSGARASILA